jgi:glycosyltransferase involved in cell wall biosynthesis
MLKNKSLKVLLVFGHRNKSGAIRMVAGLSTHLQGFGVEPFLAVEHKKDFETYPESSGRITEIGGLTGWRSLPGKLAAVPIILKLAHLLKVHQIDVVYVHHLAAFPYSLAASRLMSVPHVVAVRNIYSKKSRYKKLMLHRADNILAASAFMLTAVNDFLGESNCAGRFVVHNGIDIAAFLSSSEGHAIPEHLRPPKENVIVGMVSAMDRNKDPQFLLKVARSIVDVEPCVSFLFAGRFPDPEYERETKSLVERLELRDHAIFAGHQKEISPFFAAFDILAHPSPKRPEPFGLVLIEAMAHGKPIVASRLGGIPEIVVHDQTGILCEPNNQQDFVQTLLKLIREPELRREMGRRGQKRVQENFSIEKAAEAMAEVLHTVADR